MKMRLTMALALMTLTSTASMAGGASDRLVDGNGCPLLMTEKECAVHTTTLARLPPGGARDTYLLAHNQLLREREKACPCSRNMDSEIRSAEIRHHFGRQAVLRF